MARLLGAQALVLVTAVDHVTINYGTPRQAKLGLITMAEAERHLRDGQFPPGSMGPKVEAALAFLAEGGEWAAITSPRLVAATLSGEDWAGTRIEGSPSRVGQDG
jgi:carbamate kinase